MGPHKLNATRLPGNMRIKAIPAVVILLLLTVLFGCGDKDLRTYDSNPLLTDKGEQSAVQRELTAIPENLLKIQGRIFSDITLIETSCVQFHTAFIRMPVKLEELFDTNFVVFWPQNWKSGGPVKILDTPPDPSNPDHIGNVFFNRKGEHEASLQYLTIDLERSTEDTPVYMLVDFAIIAPLANQILGVNPGDDPYWSLSRELKELSDNERYRYAYKEMLAQPFHFLSCFYMLENDKPAGSLQEMLTSDRFLIFSQGFEYLNKMISEENLELDLGFFDNDHAYYTVNFQGEEKATMYINVVYSTDLRKSVTSTWNATDGVPLSAFNQSMIGDLSIPQDLFITVEDVQ
jgi:hypothetical protein